MPRKFIISGGGTGGHIFPAIAIANGIKEREPDAQILFVGALGKMEMEKVPQAGYEIVGLNISGLKRSLSLSNLAVPFRLMKAVLEAGKIIRQFKPDVVIGVGGYASSAVLHAASRRRIPTLIQEQNSYPGITNKILGRKAARICVAYDKMDRFFPAQKIVFTGNPVRKEILQETNREEAIRSFGLDPSKITVLAVGGSLGALSINESVAANLKRFDTRGIQVIWQTGAGYYPKAQEALRSADCPGIRCFDFIREMHRAYGAADIVLSRAGALAVSELCLVKKPCILVPYPFAAEDHQTRNAMSLVEKEAAILVKDDQIRSKLGDLIENLADDEGKRKSLASNIAAMARKDATSSIVNEIYSLLK